MNKEKYLKALVSALAGAAARREKGRNKNIEIYKLAKEAEKALKSLSGDLSYDSVADVKKNLKTIIELTNLMIMKELLVSINIKCTACGCDCAGCGCRGGCCVKCGCCNKHIAADSCG